MYNIHNVVEAMKEICSIHDNDGVAFDNQTVTANEIKENDPYGGLRAFVMAKLDTIQQRLQVDIGFGDTIYPEPVKISFPVLLNNQSVPQINAYSIETIIAEKFHAMIDLADINSRLKDFYDVYKLIEAGDYNDTVLQQAVKATFKTRNTKYMENHILFKEEFWLDKLRNKNWAAFNQRVEIENPASFSTVMGEIKRVLLPVWESLH
jgi:hypothetical protein